MKLVVIGGGPAGLYFSLLVRKRLPYAEVHVHEQNAADATYGFGIVLADRSLERFREADRGSHDAILAASLEVRDRTIVHRSRALFVRGGESGRALARLSLLGILRAACEDAGVHVHQQSRIETPDVLGDAVLTVGADGINSAVRGQRESQFGTTRRYLANRLAWYGTTRRFSHPTLSFRHGTRGYFVAVAYPHADEMSTFVVECDADTWSRSGLQVASDEGRRQLVQEIFETELGGHPVISCRAAWERLPIIRNRIWSVGSCVLIGDALHSSHPSIGSGTRIAMEDALALAESVVQHAAELRAGDPQPALARFRAAREPQKLKLLHASDRSVAWYDQFPSRMEKLGAVDFVFDYLMRTGRVDRERLRSEYPEFTSQFGDQPHHERAAT